MKCIICGNKLTGLQQKYCSKPCKQKTNLNANYQYQQNRGLSRKLELISISGGKCSKCGYAGNLAALVFHHLDPKEKGLKLDMRHLSNRKMDVILSELSKCILLCSNCHMEIHHPELDLGQLLQAGRSDR